MPLTDLMAAVRTLVSPAADRDTVLHAAADLLSCRQAGADELYANLCEREALGSTAIGHGIAIPHGRCPNLTEPRGALLRLDTPVPFGSDEPVDLVFAMAVPAHYTHQHLMLLSELAERFSDADFRRNLRAAPNADALMALLADVPPAQASAA
ncbi:PTS fructose transporter subunit IIA [Xanthomonas phaseoli pv. phaseoli]|uniref:PTS fructose transporter subunit IIA n=6 Tax=Xanthomonas TaxID=338 RepID=A0AA45BWH0_XANCM|nr:MULTISPECIES: PTS sugar transporter subunit IIA [Xanthomonas]OOW51177.1 PTS fructose transporter subunit IIA [Xanthomonas campestris pv. centellae]OOW58995.1 PTS fructose transporter subunit IIA [Xanthomonas campestris pv. thespesiae]OOW80158.1 PTS fructose transporter subunit IIA [Xanthomonas campestris pv. leeana]OOW86518.1 PTS fructose transporter subunit IIA [Xanthomonas campestris pv. vitiswoodrowii]OOW94059.1 PTS fructose transporter subunit IIA [Xanthomonas campestris pv. vitistrifol